MRFCASYMCSFKTLFFVLGYIMLCLGRTWVSVGVETQPPIQWVPGTFYLLVKRPGREAGHSPPYSAEVKNAWNYTSTNTSSWHGAYLSIGTLPYEIVETDLWKSNDPPSFRLRAIKCIKRSWDKGNFYPR